MNFGLKNIMNLVVRPNQYRASLSAMVVKSMTVVAYFLLLVFSSTTARSQINTLPNINIVFDLDWTLLNPTNEEMARAFPKNIIRVGKDVYRISDHTIDVLIALHSEPGVLVSFFSGGEDVRNREAIAIIYQMISEKIGHSRFQPNKILSASDLEVVSDDPNLKFSERKKKNIVKHFNSTHSVLVEDVRNFILPGQERLLLWLGKTYNDRPIFSMAALEDPKDAAYSAPDYKEWLRNQNRLLPVREVLLAAIRLTRQNGNDFVDNLSVTKDNRDRKSCLGLFK
jgi:hypothetical protein